MRVHPTVVQMAVNFYSRKLIELNPVFLGTPAAIEKLNRQAEALRMQQRRRETNPVWDLPVEIQPDGTNPTRFQVFVRTDE